MNGNLKEVTEKWMQLERKTFEQRKLADDFYEKNLMKLIIEDYVDRNKVKVATIKKALFGRSGGTYLPDQVSLLEGYIILYALHDPITAMKDPNDIAILKRIRYMVFLRNNSIFAHGLGPVTKSDFDKFHIFVEEMFKKECSIEKVNFEECFSDVKYVSPMDSVNYNIQLGD